MSTKVFLISALLTALPLLGVAPEQVTHKKIKDNHHILRQALPTMYDTATELQHTIIACRNETEETLKAIQKKFSQQPAGVALSLEQLAPFQDKLKKHYYEQQRLLSLQKEADARVEAIREYYDTAKPIGLQLAPGERTNEQSQSHVNRKALDEVELEKAAKAHSDMRKIFENDATLANHGFAAFCRGIDAAYYIPGNDSDYQDCLSTLNPLTTASNT